MLVLRFFKFRYRRILLLDHANAWQLCQPQCSETFKRRSVASGSFDSMNRTGSLH